MLEWLMTLGAAELGKAVFEQGLKLGQTAAEDYVFELYIWRSLSKALGLLRR